MAGFKLFLFLLLNSSVLSSAGFTAKIGGLVRLHGQDGGALGTEWFRVAASLLIAEKHVNERFSELVPSANTLPQGFNISVDLKDTRSAPTLGVQHAIQWGSEDYHGIVGAPRSAVSGPVALVSAINNLAVVSYWSTAASLSDKGIYPTFNRVIPSDAVLAAAMIGVCKSMNWNRIGLMYLDDAYGTGYAQDVADRAGRENMQVASAQKFTSGNLASVIRAVETIAASDVRIIIVITFVDDMEAILMTGNQLGLFQPGYVWITSDAVVHPSEVLNAFPSNPLLPELLTGFLGLLTDPLYGEKGRNFKRVWDSESPNFPRYAEIIKDVAGSPFTLEAADLEGDCELCGYAYDAVFTLVLAMAGAITSDGNDISKIATIDRMRPTNFEGATGTVALTNDGDRAGDGLTVVLRNWIPKEPERQQEIGVWTGTRLELHSEPSPTWIGGEKGWNIPKDPSNCETGTIYSTSEQACTPCAAGTYQEGFECKRCAKGNHSPVSGMTRCLPCTDGYADEEGMASCAGCPANTFRPIGTGGGLNKTECVCHEDFYARNGVPGEPCDPCPVGAECPGLTHPPHPAYGYWGDRECKQFGLGGQVECDSWDKFIECFPRDFCTGGENFSCKPGHAGKMCLEAEDGWFILGGSFWQQCGDNGGLVTILGIFAVILVWFGINAVASGNFDALDIALLFVQIVGMISTYGLNWHSNLWEMNTAMGIANFDVDFVTPLCLISWPESASFFLQLSLPFIVGLIWVLAYFLYHEYKVHVLGVQDPGFRQRLEQDLTGKIFSFIVIVYHTLCLKCFRALRCEEFPDGKEYLKFAPQQQCWDSTHWAMFATSIVYIPVVIIGVPLTVFCIVYRYSKKGSLHSEYAMGHWGFLYARYEADWKWWETMLILRRLVIAFVSIFFDTSMIQAGLSMVFLCCFLSAHVFAAPYISSSIDCLDFFGILGAMFFVLSGLLFYPSLTQEAQGHVCLEGFSDGDSFCEADLTLKHQVSIITLAWLSAILGVAAYFAYDFVGEVASSHKASRIVANVVRANQETSSALEKKQGLQRMASFSRRVVTDVSNTVNKITLDEVLRGRQLLSWAQHLEVSRKDHSEASVSIAQRFLAATNQKSELVFNSAAAFMVVDKGIRALEDDVTHYSTSDYARLVRQLSEIPELIDWLSHGATFQERQALFTTLKSWVEFCSSRPSTDPLPFHGLVMEDHRPVVISYLMQCPEKERLKFCQLLDAVKMSNSKGNVDEGQRRKSHFGLMEELQHNISRDQCGSAAHVLDSAHSGASTGVSVVQPGFSTRRGLRHVAAAANSMAHSETSGSQSESSGSRAAGGADVADPDKQASMGIEIVPSGENSRDHSGMAIPNSGEKQGGPSTATVVPSGGSTPGDTEIAVLNTQGDSEIVLQSGNSDPATPQESAIVKPLTDSSHGVSETVVKLAGSAGRGVLSSETAGIGQSEIAIVQSGENSSSLPPAPQPSSLPGAVPEDGEDVDGLKMRESA